jgi:hypothetical protein
MMRARSAMPCGVLGARTQPSSVRRRSSESTI